MIARASLLATAASLILVPAVARAGDASWLWCHGVATVGAKADARKMFFAASLVEGRKTADTRSVVITLVKGVHLMRGELGEDSNGAASGPVTLTTTPAGTNAKPVAVFTGTAKLPEDFSSFTLSGTIDMSFGDDAPMKTPFAATLACKTLDDLAIGH